MYKNKPVNNDFHLSLILVTLSTTSLMNSEEL